MCVDKETHDDIMGGYEMDNWTGRGNETWKLISE